MNWYVEQILCHGPIEIAHIVHLAWITMHLSLCKLVIICLDIYFANMYINIWHFGARRSDITDINNGLNTIHVFDIERMMHDKRYIYGVRTCFIISNQAGASHVSIWNAFTKTYHPSINKSLRNMPIYMSRTLCKIKHFTSTVGPIDSGRIVCWGMWTYTCLLLLMVVPF